MAYIIKRTDHQGGGYVTPAGSEHSYTKDIAKARIFQVRPECCENEVVLRVDTTGSRIRLEVGK